MTASIGLLAYGTNRFHGGIGRYTQELIVAFCHLGVKFQLLRAGGDNHAQNAITLPGAELLPALLTLGQLEIAWHTQKHNFNIIHDPTGTMPLYLANTCRVSTIHDVIPYIHPRSAARLDWLIYRFWLPLAVRRLDAIITDSKRSKKDIVHYLSVRPEKVIVVPIGANAHYRVLPMTEVRPTLVRYGIDIPYILYVGSLTARKNVPRLLEAYARLHDQSARLALVIASGGNWNHSSNYEMVDKLDLIDKVHFTGYVGEDDLPALYNGADLFVFPSLYEGFGLPVLEAMACGTPVITSNTSSLPEVAGDAAILVDPYDIQAIAKAMRRLLEDKDLARDMRAKGLERAKQFTWERTARETVQVYEKVLGYKLIS